MALILALWPDLTDRKTEFMENSCWMATFDHPSQRISAGFEDAEIEAIAKLLEPQSKIDAIIN